MTATRGIARVTRFGKRLPRFSDHHLHRGAAPRLRVLCRPLWRAAQAGTIAVISSDLTLLETLVRPLRLGDTLLQRDLQDVLLHAELTLHAVTREVLFEAARLRALRPSLRTPDSIHVATALLEGCDLFLTNDRRVRPAPGLNVTVLDELLP